MKNIKIKILLILICIITFLNISFSQTPTYQLSVRNIDNSASDSLTFDIYLMHTNPAIGVFEFALGQYFMDFNPLIANGGTLTYRIIGSELPSGAQPRNPTISGSQLRLVSNGSLAQNGPIIPSTSPGVLVVRMSLRTSASSFAAGQTLNLSWRNSAQGNPFTKLFAYINDISTEITNASSNIIVSIVQQLSTEIPDRFNLSQNYPNPFNPSTKINFALPKAGFLSLKVYNITGKEVGNLVNEKLGAGNYEYEFNGAALSSGTYFYRIQTSDFSETKRMILIK